MQTQISLFDGTQDFKIDKPIRLIELFGGIGSQAKALENLGADFEHYRLCEFDKYAIASYNAVHHTNFVTSDITKINASDLGIVDTDKYEYIMTYSFPCQDLSNAGLGKGMDKGSGTRSGLLWEVERLLNECNELPQILLMENVPQVHSQKNMENFSSWVKFLESKGYKCYWEDLNAKNFGIPQNRERCFMVSILGDYFYTFPLPVKLKLHLKDLLEKDVDEKFYLSDNMLNYLYDEGTSKFPRRERFLQNMNRKDQDISNCITTNEGNRPVSTFITSIDNKDNNLKKELCNKLIEEGKVVEGDVIRHSYTNNRLNNGDKNMSRIENHEGISPTLDTRCDCLGVCVKNPNIELKKVGKLVGGKWEKVYDCCKYIYDTNGLSPTLDTCGGGYREPKILVKSSCKKGRTQSISIKECQTPIIYDEQNNKLHADGVCNTIMCDGSSPGHNPRIIEEVPRLVGGIGEKKSNKNTQWYQQDRIYDSNGIAMCHPANLPYGSYKYLVRQDTPIVGQFQPKDRDYNKHHKGREEHFELRNDDLANSVLTGALKNCVAYPSNYRIRKLTPKECWRLMGFSDVDFENAAALNSNAQLYKQAGNSIVVDVLMAIFKQML